MLELWAIVIVPREICWYLYPSTDDGSDHLITIPAATSADFEPGNYYYQKYVTDGTNRYTLIRDGKIEVLPDFSTKTDGFDARNWLDLTIDALEASIKGGASKTQLMHSVNGVQIQYLSTDEKRKELMSFKRMRAAKKGKIFKTIGSRFKN